MVNEGEREEERESEGEEEREREDFLFLKSHATMLPACSPAYAVLEAESTRHELTIPLQ